MPEDIGPVTGYRIGLVEEYDGVPLEPDSPPTAWYSGLMAVDAELRGLADESTALKRQIEEIREKRRAVNERANEWIAERVRLYRLRGVHAGDITVAFTGAGGDE